MSIRVLVADDSILFRRVLTDALTSLPDVEVVGSAINGRFAIQKVRDLRPDLLTLDLEMPEMDGLATLDALRQAGEGVQVMVVSAVTRRGGELTMRAMEKGAFDFITKPEAATPEQNREALARELAPRVRALAHRLEVRSILRGGTNTTFTPSSTGTAAPTTTVSPKSSDERTALAAGLTQVTERMNRLVTPTKPEMVLIGVSTGGPAALARLLPEIPKDIGVPILIVQHMPPLFTQSLAESLSVKCAATVREAIDGEPAEAGTIYIAPGGRQMRVVASEGRPRIQITDDPPENNCKPSVDTLFRSAAHQFPGRSMALILTGMGSDGTLGLRLLKRHGCYVIAQNEATCVVYGMPKAAVDAGVTDAVLPLESIAGQMIATIRGWKA